jgi:hypothetical protein
MERFITFLCKRYFFPFIKISHKTSNIDTIPLIIALIFANMWGSKLTSIFKFNSCKNTTARKTIADTEIMKILAFLSFLEIDGAGKFII